MTEGKSVEELEAEYKTLLQGKVMELQKEKEKELQQMQKEKEELAKKEEREHLKEELKKELGFITKSRLDDQSKQTMNMSSEQQELINYGKGFVERRNNQDGFNMKGLPYTELLRQIKYGDYKIKGKGGM